MDGAVLCLRIVSGGTHIMRGRVRVVWAAAVALSATTALVAGAVFVVAQAFESDPAPSPAATASADDAQWREISVRPLAVRRAAANPKAIVVRFALPAGTACARDPRGIVLAESPRNVSFGVRVAVASGSCTGAVRGELAVAARSPLGSRTVVVNAVTYAPAAPGTYRRCPATGCAPRR